MDEVLFCESHIPADLKSEIKEKHSVLVLTDDQFNKVRKTFRREMIQGLSKDEEIRSQSSLQMENTFVRSLLDGTELGEYLALDLGGTNLRVLLCRLKPGGKLDSVSKFYNLDKATLMGPSYGVFDHIAESIGKFLQEVNHSTKKALPLGFTFSFPMSQRGIKKGILLTWTKTFKCTDGAGKDAVEMLEDALKRKNLSDKVRIVAILNDTTGTLLAGSFLNHRCSIGLILGTGHNIAYIEKAQNVGNWGLESKSKNGIVVIDTECGAFGDNGSLDFFKTKQDFLIDSHSNHVGSFTFEKLFAGHYIGNLVRLHLENLLIDHEPIIPTDWGKLTAKHVTEIERSEDDDNQAVKRILCDLFQTDKITDKDCSLAKYICRAVSIRCCQLVSAVILEIAQRINPSDDHIVIAIDGSWYKHHPKMKKDLMDILMKHDPQRTYELILANDGSGNGAAFAAAVCCRLENK